MPSSISQRSLPAATLLLVAAAAATAQPYDLPEHREQARHIPLMARMHGGLTGRAWDPESGAPFDLDAHRTCAKECTLRQYFEMGLDPRGLPTLGDRGPGGGDGPGDPTDVLNNALDIEVAPPGNSISGSNTMTIRSNVNGLDTFRFQLRWNFDVTACTITDSMGTYTVTPPPDPSSTAVPPSYARTITLTRPVNQGETFTLRIDYNGLLQSGIGLGSVFYGGQNNNAANPGVVCTLSEPYYAGTWWPCKDGDLRLAGDNSDKATLQCSITAPSNFASVSNGLLQGIDQFPVVASGKKRYRWATTYPMTTYLVFFSTTEYDTFTSTYNYGTPEAPQSMPLDFYIYRINNTVANRNEWLKVVNMLAAYRPIYGLYPFINEKYGIYQFEFSGGEEHQTFTGQGGGGAFVESITAHELGHQWWGDNITCRTWSDIWLNEGFATYTESLWEEWKTGTQNLAAFHSALNARRPSDANGTVWIAPYNPADPNNLTNNTGNAGRIFDSRYSYRKPGWVLAMLRHIVGDATFTNILQTYRTTFDGGTATTAEFTALASAVAGQSLTWFFDPWLYQLGAPVYRSSSQNVTINGQNYLRLRVEQTQTTATTFDMPVDVRIVTTTAGTVNTVVRNDARSDYFLIPLPAPASTITLDPDNWILEYGKTSVAYTQGPAKIITLAPAAGATIAAAGAPTSIAIGFSDAVTASAADFTVTRDGTPVPFTLSYSPATLTATLTFAAPLSSGSYAVGVSDNIRTTTGAIALDGELTLLAGGAAVLPSGEGAAGGLGAYGFTIEPPLPPACPPDINNSGDLSVQDIFDFLAAYFAGAPAGNFNGDAGISVQDIFDFLAAYFNGC